MAHEGGFSPLRRRTSETAPLVTPTSRRRSRVVHRLRPAGGGHNVRGERVILSPAPRTFEESLDAGVEEPATNPRGRLRRERRARGDLRSGNTRVAHQHDPTTPNEGRRFLRPGDDRLKLLANVLQPDLVHASHGA
jgi:hypothetical protein